MRGREEGGRLEGRKERWYLAQIYLLVHGDHDGLVGS